VRATIVPSLEQNLCGLMSMSVTMVDEGRREGNGSFDATKWEEERNQEVESEGDSRYNAQDAQAHSRHVIERSEPKVHPEADSTSCEK
jgi:hypothetical protein